MKLGVYRMKSAIVVGRRMKGDPQERTSWCGRDKGAVSTSSSSSVSSSSLAWSDLIEGFTSGIEFSAESSSCDVLLGMIAKRKEDYY